MTETRVIEGALMTVRTARVAHVCGEVYPGGHQILPGEQYEDWRVPPWTGANESPTWWQGKRHAGAPGNHVCHEIEAYREKAVREQRTLLVGPGLLKQAGVAEIAERFAKGS